MHRHGDRTVESSASISSAGCGVGDRILQEVAVQHRLDGQTDEDRPGIASSNSGTVTTRATRAICRAVVAMVVMRRVVRSS